MNSLDVFTHASRVAYFSMEIALANDIPTYSGGLGILAGDTMRSAADLSLPMVGVTLVSRAGYFRQEIDINVQQLEHTVLPLYSEDRGGWVSIMKQAISKNASFFNSHRMMQRYVTEVYVH